MNTCDYCGEYKKVRKQFDYTFNIHWEKIYLKNYFWICEDCKKAKDLIEKKELENSNKEREEKQKEWIKERNKILKESDLNGRKNNLS